MLPPNFKELKKRLIKRHKENIKIAEERILNAKNDMKHWSEYDEVFVNKNINKCSKEIMKKIDLIVLNNKKKNFVSRFVKKFKFKIMEHISNLTNLIENLKKLKKNVSVYGASGKGQALLQFCKLDNKKIDFVFDKSKLKEGSFTPGTNIKILNPTMIKKINPDFLLLLSWNLKKEILNQEKKFHNVNFL